MCVKYLKVFLCCGLATLVKMIKDILPPDVACAKETQNLLMDSCVGRHTSKYCVCGLYILFEIIPKRVEFIHLLASQANEICEQTTKKTISPEHLLQSLTQLGFDSYIEEVKQAFGEHKQELKVIIILFGNDIK